MSGDRLVIIPPEITEAAIDGLLRRKLGPLAQVATNAAIVEAAGQATAVLSAVWTLLEDHWRNAAVSGE